MPRVLIVDDDPGDRRHTAATLEALGYTALTAADGEAALAALRADPLIAAVVLDLVMPDRDGMAVLEALARERRTPPVIVAVAAPSRETVASALNAGAADYVEKPVAPVRLAAALANARRRAALEAALRAGESRRSGSLGLADLATRSPVMDRVRAVALKAARSALPLLVEGEPGTGREHLARIVHAMGERAGRPFVVCDATLPAPGLTGAIAATRGGTLLVREIGELSPTDQALLLEVLATGHLRRPGVRRAERIGLRLVASSSRRLVNLARTGELDPGLYNRLNVLPVYLPPLRERLEDVPLLADLFFARETAVSGRRLAGLSPAADALLRAYAWPGNIAELEAAIRRAVALAARARIEPVDLPHLLVAQAGRHAAAEAVRQLNAPSAPVHIDSAKARPKPMEGPDAAPDRFLTPAGEVTPLADLERAAIAFALRRYGGRMSGIARALGIGRSTLYRKLREHGLEGGAGHGTAGEPDERRLAAGR